MAERLLLPVCENI